jgi:hypothetical protein
MGNDVQPKGNRRSLVKQDAHLRWFQPAEGRVFQYGFGLCECHTGEPFDKLVEGRVCFQVLKQRSHGHTGAAKHPSATQAISVAFNGRAV